MLTEVPNTTTAIRPVPRAAAPPAIRFNSIQEVLDTATVLYRGGMTPNGVDRPEKLVPMILAGVEAGLGVMASIECVTPPVNGKVTLYGDAGLGLIRASGLLASLVETVSGDGDARTASCTIQRLGYPARTFEYRMETAKKLASYQGQMKKQIGPWYLDADNMLTWRARWKGMRTEFTDVLKGLGGAEERDDEVITAEVMPQAAPTTTTTAALPAEPTGRRAELMAEVAKLRGHVLAAQPDQTDAGRTKAWLDVLAPLGVASARDLSGRPARRARRGPGAEARPFYAPHADAGIWPGELAAILKRHRPYTVWRAGIAALGYPPTWITTGGEVFALTKELESWPH